METSPQPLSALCPLHVFCFHSYSRKNPKQRYQGPAETVIACEMSSASHKDNVCPSSTQTGCCVQRTPGDNVFRSEEEGPKKSWAKRWRRVETKRGKNSRGSDDAEVIWWPHQRPEEVQHRTRISSEFKPWTWSRMKWCHLRKMSLPVGSVESRISEGGSVWNQRYLQDLRLLSSWTSVTVPLRFYFRTEIWVRSLPEQEQKEKLFLIKKFPCFLLLTETVSLCCSPKTGLK